jgi:transcriptional regulator with XRE-family HTH domain
MNLGEAVRSARKEMGMTQAELASHAGVSRQAIVLLEQNAGTVATLRAVRPCIRLHVANIALGDDLHLQVSRVRERRGWSQADAARRAGVAIATLRAVERGGGSVSSLSRVIAVLAPEARRNARPPSYFRSRDDVRLTPPEFLAHIRVVFGDIDLDPCAAPNSFVAARREIGPSENGLRTMWSGRVAFVNPPYSRLTEWIGRCADAHESGEVETVIGLFPVRTESRVFKNRVIAKADILLLQGRMKFLDGSRSALKTAPFALMVCCWGAKLEEIVLLAGLLDCTVIWREDRRSLVDGADVRAAALGSAKPRGPPAPRPRTILLQSDGNERG